jgi:hypothetical protein
MKLSIEDVVIENLVPEPLQRLKTIDAFIQELSLCDEMYRQRIHELKKKEKCLCYVGHISSSSSQGCTAGLKE